MNKEFTRMQKLAGLITEGLYTTQMYSEEPVAKASMKVTKKELKEKIKEMMLSDDVTEGRGRMYYHVLEDVGGEIGHQGYYNTKEEAQKMADKLADMFPESFFYVEASDSKAEPTNVTLEGETPGEEAYDEMGNLDEDLFEAKKDEESDTEDVIVADTDEEVPAEGGEDISVDASKGDTEVDVNMDGVPDVDTGSAESKKAFTSLVDTYNASKELGDPKLTQMIANALTYYNKNIILKAGQPQA